MTRIADFARFGEQPTLKVLPPKNGNDARNIAEFRISLMNSRRKAEGDFEDRSVWADAAVWDELAAIVVNGFRQGDKVFVVGDLTAVHWKDQDGNPRTTNKLYIEEIFPDTRALDSWKYKPRRSVSSEPASQPEQEQPVA